MSSMDPMKDDFWTRYGTKQRTLLRPSHFKRLLNTKSSSLMRQITQGTMYNSSYGQILRHFITTADSSSPATTKTKSLNHFTPDVPSLILQQPQKIVQRSQHPSSNVSNKSLLQRVLNLITRSW